MEARRRRFPRPGHRIFLVGGELRHSCNWEGRDACQQRGEALAPAPAQTQAQNLLAAVGAADGADDQQPVRSVISRGASF